MRNFSTHPSILHSTGTVSAAHNRGAAQTQIARPYTTATGSARCASSRARYATARREVAVDPATGQILEPTREMRRMWTREYRRGWEPKV